MSADNIIYVQQIGAQWFVQYGSASCVVEMAKGKSYSTREAALVAAHDLEKETGYVEYGVNELEAIP